ncbi:MAG: aminotransferase class III-fold pyridoxal phosphate-dependent enzyme, partial [Chlorobiales bacterium]|nr:aminotransferase class III-fold pyridoxal phosphate-dependent enzyme [Chlorobiales bacterium]
MLATRRQYTNPAIFTFYQEPLMLVEGHMQYLFDETGRRYLDLFAGIVTVSCGHCHPTVMTAIREQVETLQHTTTIYLHPNLGAYAKALASRLPDGIDVSYFVNSGSDANDLAIQMARLYTGSYDVIAVRNAYHGGSPTAQGLTSLHTWKYPLPNSAGVHHVPCPDPYRSHLGCASQSELAERCAEEIRDLI